MFYYQITYGEYDDFGVPPIFSSTNKLIDKELDSIRKVLLSKENAEKFFIEFKYSWKYVTERYFPCYMYERSFNNGKKDWWEFSFADSGYIKWTIENLGYSYIEIENTIYLDLALQEF